MARFSQTVICRFYADRAVNIWAGNPARAVGQQVALEQLKSDIVKDTNPEKFIWVTSVSRIARNRKKGREFFEWAMANGIPIWVEGEIFEPTKLDASTWFDACVVAEEFGDRLSAQATQQHEDSTISGRKKWGFENVGRQRVMKPAARELVAQLFAMALKGATFDELGAEIGRSRAWGERNSSQARLKAKARKIIHDPNYAGYEPIYGNLLHRQTIRLERANYDGAVSIRDFLQVQLLLPKKVVNGAEEFYLAGRVNCHLCRRTLVPVATDFRGNSYEQLKLVKTAYACPTSGCRPSCLYDAEKLHYEAKLLLQEWERVQSDKGFYERWEGASREQQRQTIKDTISSGRLLIATPAGLENPVWLRNVR